MSLSVLKYLANSRIINRAENWAVKEIPVKGDVSKKVTNYSRMQKIYPNAAMLFAVGIQTGFIYNSKDMTKERKIPLILNNAIACVLAIIGGLIMHKPIGNLLEKMVSRANIIYPANSNKESLINGMKTAVPFLVSALLFKYIGAVLATPLADKANKFLVKKGIVNYSNNN